MTMFAPKPCWICAFEGPDVERTLAYLSASDERPETYQPMVRCRDQIACRLRCEAAGDKWPLMPAAPVVPPAYRVSRRRR